MKKKLRILTGVLTALIGISILAFVGNIEENETSPAHTLTENEDITIPKNLEFGIYTDSFLVIKQDIKRNEFLANILSSFNIDYSTIALLAKKSKEIFDVRKMAAGKPYTILATKDSMRTAQYFIYQPNPIDYIIYDLRDTIRIIKGKKEVEVHQKAIGGKINSSLYVTLQESNAATELALKMADIFAWSIDFYRIQKGDWFKVIYEEEFVDGESVGIGKVLGVQFNHFNEDFYAFHFEKDTISNYFDQDANSMRKAFLKSPLKFSRLSSRFTMRRFHPVQKRWKAHLGTDYAAPSGSPIMSTGDGIVIEASYTRGNGNYVKVKHNSVYTTQYLHMSKRNTRVGQRVRQGDVIGYVGSTGLATGPHVCYRFWKNGKQVDHLRQKFPPAKPLEADYKAEFDILKGELQQKLKRVKLISEDGESEKFSNQLSMK